jgi:predicted acyltransferase
MAITGSVDSETQKSRYLSLDTLRGFDMFWIIGARSLATGLASLNLPGICVITGQLYHTKWNGFTFCDLIFPLFIFIMGVSLVLSLQKRVERGDNRGSLVRHVLTRTVILFIMGLVYNNGAAHLPTLANMRYMGVLQRSALCYFFASMLVLFTKPRTQAATVVGILVGYWAIMQFIPVPGYGAGVWTEQANLARYVDNLLLPGRLFYGSWDPEGLISTIPAIATCLLGALSGHWLRISEWHHKQVLNANQRMLYLFLAGLALVLLGLLFNHVFPINKNLWTSSYVLLSGGLSAMLLSAFHWVIDIRGHQRWAFPFIIIGMNSIFIYIVVRFVQFDKIIRWIAGGNFLAFFGRGQTLFVTLVQFSIEGLLLFWLYNRKAFIRI